MKPGIVILRYLDDPERFFLWTLDELLVLMVPIVISVFMEQFLAGLAMSLFLLWGYMKLKRIYARNLFGFLYWHLPSSWCQFTRWPLSCHRTWLG